MDSPKRLVVLISGNGSNLQAVLNACEDGVLPAQVVLVVSNRSDAYGIQRAQNAGVKVAVLPVKKGQDRGEYDRQLADQVAQAQPDWIVLAGWMRIFTSTFLNRFAGRVINLHPALPGKYPGTRAIERAYESFLCGEIDHTGVMVHLVPDEGVDNGPVLAQESVPILPGDTLDTLEERVHQVEHRLLVDTLKKILTGNL